METNKVEGITKELLTALRNDGRVIVELDLTDIILGHNGIGYSFDTPEVNQVWCYDDIHTIAHKCKLWALDKDIILSSFYDYYGAFCKISTPSWMNDIPKPKTFSGSSEPEAIFKACQWILENYKVVK